MSKNKLEAVLAAIDNINQEDTNTTTYEGQEYAKELLYGQLMTKCLIKHWPQASNSLQIAVRAQHIKRWHFPRSDFPMNRAGYLNWRKELGHFHAKTAKDLMIQHDYTELESETVAQIIRKEKIKSNSESQTLEDVACLVFLQYYFDAFIVKHTEEKIISILQKTWKKMSQQGQEIALTLTLSKEATLMITKALS